MTLENTSTNNLRPPVVTIMGHVDHGKTTLLDTIRKSNVAAREHGGITQHTAAYQITFKDRRLTFIDTPGHAAFSQMRSRGGQVADIVVLVVSVPDGVQPQTVEAISHAKAANVPIIVALNKMDQPEAAQNLPKVTQQLAEAGLMLESYGGDIVAAEISAKTGAGVPELLDVILLVADLLDLKADPAGPVMATIIESKIDSKRGVLVSSIVRSGTLTPGQKIYVGETAEKVRSLLNDFGEAIKTAGPGDPVTILGLAKLPPVGQVITSQPVPAGATTKPGSPVTTAAGVNTLTLILKSDTQGTLEAITSAIKKLETAKAKVIFLSTGVGDIADSDLLLAMGTNALIMGFNVRASSTMLQRASDAKVNLKLYTIIYELLDSVKKTLAEGLVVAEDAARGRAEVIALFPLPSGDIVAGCRVTKGRLKTGEKIQLFRDEATEPAYSGKIHTLKEGKQEVNLVTGGKECGVLLRPIFSGIAKGDKLVIS